MSDIFHGKVKWWDNKKGYGYVTGEDGRDYFCHYSHIESDHRFKKLGQDWEVDFTPIVTEKGMMVDWCKVTKVVYPESKEEQINKKED